MTTIIFPCPVCGSVKYAKSANNLYRIINIGDYSFSEDIIPIFHCDWRRGGCNTVYTYNRTLLWKGESVIAYIGYI